MGRSFGRNQAFSVGSSKRPVVQICDCTSRRRRRGTDRRGVYATSTGSFRTTASGTPMIGSDMRLVIAALAGILLAVLMIVRGRLHPFIGLLCGAFTVGLLAGLPLPDVAKAVQ